MPFLQRDGYRLWWRSDGDPAKPPLLLGNSLGTDVALWDVIVPRLIERFRVIRHDKRGHGASEAPAGDYTIEALSRDALAVADAAGVDRFNYAGISIGGMIGQWLGAHAAERLDKLVLSNTSPKMSGDIWAARIDAVRKGGTAAIVDAVVQRWFTAPFLSRNPPAVATARSTLTSVADDGYIGCCVAIRDMDQRATAAKIRAPTLVITGTHDAATPPDHGQSLARSIPGARLVELPVAHIPVVEAPGAFAHAVLDFLVNGAVDNDRARYDAGLARRKEALGRDYVDARLANVNDFNRDFQDFITRYAWGEAWTRHVLDDRTRRLV
ncbi:MAG TPA: 3-oxoadipate enol-lactonase, partial [Casimicrobiaceae bacterium]|nr:3-oxoadipate enol-lactonase [Casimicrobiaceae bacterium]